MNRTVEVNTYRMSRLSVISGNCERCGSTVELTPFDRDGVKTVVCVECKQMYDVIETLAFHLAYLAEVDLALMNARREQYVKMLCAEEDAFNES